MSDEIPEMLKDLANGVSNGVEVANRYWLALALVSLFVLVPQPTGASNAQLSLPLGMPDVDAAWFSLLSVLVLSALLIAFCSAQARLVRTTQLAQGILAERRKRGTLLMGHDERDFFDALRKPSLGQVAALAQLVRGKHQFFKDQRRLPRWQRRLSSALYLFFKVPALIVWLMLPALALVYAVVGYVRVGPPAFLTWLWPPVVGLMVASAGLAFLFAMWIEVQYFVNVMMIVWTGEDAST